MIQYYLDLENQVKTIRECRLSGGQIQKIYSTAFYISMAVRTPGKTWHLYLGRGGGYEGIWLHNCPPPSALRRKDNFLEYLRRHLSSCALIDVELDRADRIIRLAYQKFGREQVIMFFWKARKFYFLHYYQESPEAPFKLLLSWHGKSVTITEEAPDLYNYFDEVGRRKDMEHDFQSRESLTMKELLENELKAAALKGMTGSPTFLQRKKENIENDLRKARQWERLQGLLDQGAPLEGYEIKVGEHKIKFEGELNPFERRNIVYQKIKKLKRGEGILQERLKTVEEQLTGKQTEVKETSKLPIIKPIWGKDLAITVASAKSTAEEFKLYKSDKLQLGVGMSSQGNDQLRNKWATKEDYWFHLDGSKSAHVIIKLLNKSTLDPETINLAASIVAHFSHFNADWIPIIYTQVKNLKGVTGAPGMVIYKKEKHLNCPRIAVDEWLKE